MGEVFMDTRLCTWAVNVSAVRWLFGIGLGSVPVCTRNPLHCVNPRRLLQQWVLDVFWHWSAQPGG